MTGWPILPLKEVCDINPRLSKEHGISDEAEVSFVPMSAVSEVSGSITNRQTRKFADVKKGYTYFAADDVLFAKITPCMENGKAAIARDLVGGWGFGSTEFHVLRPRRTVLPEWLYYFVRRKPFREEAKRSFTGTAGQQRVPTTFLGSALIPVPPIAEQLRIIDIVSRAEGIVRLRREAHRKAAELIPALFVDMFGDPASNPKGWPVLPLGTVSEVISGVAKGRRLSAQDVVELPYLRVANVKDGHLDLREVKTIEIKRSEVDKLRIEPGDLLMTEGGDPDKLGRAALWHGEIGLCVHQNHVFKVRSNRARLSPEYLRSLVGSTYGKRYFLRVAKKTTGIASINKTQLSAFPVVLPPITAQHAFERHISAAESIERQQADASRTADETLNALLARVFSGGGQNRVAGPIVEDVGAKTLGV